MRSVRSTGATIAVARRARNAAAGAAVTVGALALSGCVSVPSLFDGERAPGDELPESAGIVSQMVDLDSSRFVGEENSVRFYAARASSHTGGVCLVIVPRTDSPVAGCGTGGAFTVQSPQASARFAVDGDVQGDGWTRLSATVSVQTR